MTEFYHQKCGLVNRALKDNNESFSVGALTVLIMMKLKGKSITDYTTDCRCIRPYNNTVATRLALRIFDSDDGEPHFSEILADWSREDYIRAIRIADIVKEMLLDVNMDIAQHSDDFMFENGETFIDFLRSPDNTTQREGDVNDRLIHSTVRINPETRTFSHIETLKKIIEVEGVVLASENIGVIDLGSQTYREQLDVRAKNAELARRNREMQEIMTIASKN